MINRLLTSVSKQHFLSHSVASTKIAAPSTWSSLWDRCRRSAWQNLNLYIVVIDLTKVCDTVNALWVILKKLSSSPKFQASQDLGRLQFYNIAAFASPSSSKCSEQRSSLHSCTTAKHGHFTRDTSNSWSSSTITLSSQSWRSAGRTKSLTKRYWTELAQQAMNPWFWKGSSDGLAMSSEWKQVFFGDLAVRYRHRGHPKKRCKENLKSYLKWVDLNSKELELAASDKASWRA